MATLTKKEYIQILEKYPDDAQIIMSFMDFLGETNCTPHISYNQYTNKIFITCGEDIEEN